MNGQRYSPGEVDRARDELFSHIQRCGVLEADVDQRGEWFDDTIEYLAERYPELAPADLASLRAMGERYCAPAISHGPPEAGDEGGENESGEVDDPEPSEASVV